MVFYFQQTVFVFLTFLNAIYINCQYSKCEKRTSSFAQLIFAFRLAHCNLKFSINFKAFTKKSLYLDNPLSFLMMGELTKNNY